MARQGKGAAAKRPRLLSNVDHVSAQAELDARLFPHYLLGRQLALEEAVRELLQAAPEKVRAQVADNLRFHADQAMERLTDGIDDPQDAACTSGYVCTLLLIGA